MKLQEKLKQQRQAEAPIFKDICSKCGGEVCGCEIASVLKHARLGRWDWYGENK